MAKIGFISSFQLMDKLGSQIAQKTKGMKAGWSYPSFFKQFIHNASPLLLYDKIILDKWGADILVNTCEDEHSKQILEALFSKRRLFHTFKTESLLKERDIQTIAEKYNFTIEDPNFKAIVNSIKSVKGESYANPDPLKFEAMNIHVLSILSNRLKELYGGPNVIIDEECRVPALLYESKINLKDNIEQSVATQFIEKLKAVPDFLLPVPETDLNNIDQFFKLREDRELIRFRTRINKITAKFEKNKIISENPVDDFVRRKKEISNLVGREVRSALIKNSLFKNSKLNTVADFVTAGFGFASLISPFLSIISAASSMLIPWKYFKDHRNKKQMFWIKEAGMIKKH